jgi:ABC-type polysaccharide/polyol phosphate export permease
MKTPAWTAENLNLLYQTTRGAFLAQEKQSALGTLWHLLNPLLTAMVLYGVFSNVLRSNQVRHYPLFILAGLIQFNFFAQGTTRAAEGLLASRSLVLNTTIPREILILRSVCLEAVTYAIEILVVGVFIVVFGDGLSRYTAWYAAVVTAQFLLTAGISFLIGAAAVLLPDLTYVWGVAMRLLFFLTPIFYSVDMVRQPWLRGLIRLNPIGRLVELGTRVLLGGMPPTFGEALAALVGPALALVVGWRIFQALQGYIPEYI